MKLISIYLSKEVINFNTDKQNFSFEFSGDIDDFRDESILQEPTSMHKWVYRIQDQYLVEHYERYDLHTGGKATDNHHKEENRLFKIPLFPTKIHKDELGYLYEYE